MKKYVALFDWDKTIQASYSFTTWSNMLIEKGIIDKEFLVENQRMILEPLRLGIINNDELADKGMSLFGKYFKGVSVDDVDAINEEYKRANYSLIYSIMTNKVFPFLNKNNIEIIVISGSPQKALEVYKSDFGIKRIYGLEHSIENEKYLDSFKMNTGTAENKQKIVDAIHGDYKEILFAFGDSLSDIPMFKSARYSFVNSSEMFFNGNNTFYLDFTNHESGNVIIEKMSECLTKIHEDIER